MECINKIFRKTFSAETFLLVFLFSYFKTTAQEIPPKVKDNTDNTIEDHIENIATNTDAELDFTDIAYKLEYYADHPLNINKATQDDLELSGLFTTLQANAIVVHRNKTGDFLASEELQTLNGFNKDFILKIIPYITVTDFSAEVKNSFKNIFKYGRSRLIIRTQQYLEKSAGYKKEVVPGEPYTGYLGSPLKLYSQYQYRYKNNFSFNVTAEKDAGEQFFDTTQRKGFDFYSAHIAVRNIGIIKSLVIGDYGLEYGQGLTLWTGLGFGKSPDVMNIKKNAEGIYPYFSVNEYAFKRGAAIGIGKKNWELDLFYSKRKIDANISVINVDTSNDQITILTSFLESGYHRTVAELQDKASLEEKFFGAHGSFTHKNFKVGVTSSETQYSSSLIRSESVYNIFQFKTKKINVTGADYSWLFKNINLFGEVSRSENGAVAYLNGAVFSLGSTIAFSVLNRNYQRNFFALYSNAFGESSTNLNERGTYFGMTAKPFSKVTLSAYYDFFTFPWLRYQVNAPSDGYEYLWQLTYVPNKQLEIYFRGRQQNKQTNSNDETVLTDYLITKQQNNYRFNLSYKVSKAVAIKSRVEAVKLKKENTATEHGFLIYQDIQVNPFSFPLSVTARYAFYDTKSYDSRIYTYENDVLYSYSIPSFYYRGSRYYLVLRYTIVKNLDIWLRYAHTLYTNQNTIGSGLDEIQGNHRSEIKAQVRFQF